MRRTLLLALLLLPTPLRAQQQDNIDAELLTPLPRPGAEIADWQEARRALVAKSTELHRAEAALARAQAIWRQSLSQLLPNIRLNVGIEYEMATEQPGAWTNPLGTAHVAVNQTIIDVSAWRGKAAGKSNEESAAATLRDMRRRTAQGLASILVAVVTAERIAELNRQGLRLALERQQITQRTFELGAATELDVVRIQQDVAVARSALIAGDEQVRVTRQALGQALGIDGEVGVSRHFAPDGLTQEIQSHCRLLRSNEPRADQVAATALVETFKQRQAQAQAGYLPRLSVSTELFSVTENPGPVGVASWTIAAVLSIPIWEGGLRRGLIDEQKALVSDATGAAEAVRRQIYLEMARARRAETVARKLVDTATEARSLATRVDEMTRRSFAIGRATSIDLVQSATTLRLAEFTLAQREFEWMQARVEAFLTEAQCDS